MESDLQTPVSVQHETPAVSGTVVVPVQVGDGVNQVVLSYDDALIAGDTTYIIQFVDEASAQATEASGSSDGQPHTDTQDGQVVEESRPESEPVVTEIEESTAESTVPEEFDDGSTDKSIAISNDEEVDRPSISEQVASPDVEDDKHQKVKLKTEFDKASSTQTRSKGITKEEFISEDSAKSSDNIVSPEADSAGSRRTNRRSIKKPARFKDTENVRKKKQTEPKYIKIPAISKKSIGLRDLFIEVEIEEKLFVSSLEKSDCENGFCKYLFRISKNPIRLVSEILSKSEDDISEPVHDTEQTIKKCFEKDLESKEDSAELTDKSLTKNSTKKSRGRPKKLKGAKQKKTDESHDENKAVEVEKESQNDDVSDGASPVEVNTEEVEEPIDCMEELDDIVKSEGILKADDINLNNKNDSEPPDKPKRKRKRKKKEEKEGNSPDDQNSQVNDKVEEEPKPKRKYVKRNAYNKDDANYTIRKDEKGKDIYKCSFCGLEIKYHGNMKDHTRTHTKETPFMCAECGKGFTNQSNYNHHLSVHSTERPFVCEVCNFCFKTKIAYKRHMRRHFGEATHTCDYCGKMFYSSTELLKHIPVHTGEKNYQCEYCSKRFNNDSSLIRHRYLHTGGGRHVCQTCGEKFIRKEYFRSHLLRAHNMELVEDYSTLPYRHRPKHMPMNEALYLENSEHLPLVRHEVEIATQEIQVMLSEANSVLNKSQHPVV